MHYGVPRKMWWITRAAKELPQWRVAGASGGMTESHVELPCEKRPCNFLMKGYNFPCLDIFWHFLDDEKSFWSSQNSKSFFLKFQKAQKVDFLKFAKCKKLIFWVSQNVKNWISTIQRKPKSWFSGFAAPWKVNFSIFLGFFDFNSHGPKRFS